MYALSHHLLKIVARNHALEPTTPTQEEIQLDVQQINHITTRLCANIRSPEQCDTLQHHVQHLCFKLHSSFSIGTLLRPSLSPNRWENLAHDRKQEFAAQCIGSYIDSVEAFLDLHIVSVAASRSWAMLHNGLTSALVLAITGQTRRQPFVAELQSRLFETLSRYPSETEQAGPFWGPHSRAISALKKIDEHRRMETTEAPQPNEPSEPVDPSSLDQCQPLRPQETRSASSALFATAPAAGALSGSQENYMFDPKTIDDLSTLLPDTTSKSDLILDDIFDSVLWGDYGGEQDAFNQQTLYPGF